MNTVKIFSRWSLLILIIAALSVPGAAVAYQGTHGYLSNEEKNDWNDEK